MLIIDFVLCTASLGAAALSFWTKRPLYTVAISYVCFALSPIMDLLDILARAGKDDTAGILDIYPTFFKGYIVLLTIITVINVLSEPNSTQASPSNGFPGKTERPSVREKLNLYKAEIAREKAERAKELAKDVVSRGLDAAKDAAKAVPIKVPGRER